MDLKAGNIAWDAPAGQRLDLLTAKLRIIAVQASIVADDKKRRVAEAKGSMGHPHSDLRFGIR